MGEHYRMAIVVGIALALAAGADAGRGGLPVADGAMPLVEPGAGVQEMSEARLAGGFGWMVAYIGYDPDTEEGPGRPIAYTPSLSSGMTPGAVPSYEAADVFAATSPRPEQLSREDLERVYALAGVPVEWREDLAIIAWCESRWQPGAVGDSGASLGLHQLWSGWFREGEDWRDPVVNARVAARVRAERGRFGGGGGWTCAELEGIE